MHKILTVLFLFITYSSYALECQDKGVSISSNNRPYGIIKSSKSDLLLTPILKKIGKYIEVKPKKCLVSTKHDSPFIKIYTEHDILAIISSAYNDYLITLSNDKIKNAEINIYTRYDSHKQYKHTFNSFTYGQKHIFMRVRHTEFRENGETDLVGGFGYKHLLITWKFGKEKTKLMYVKFRGYPFPNDDF